MIFVTVGTHEQPFDRLIKFIDILKKENKIEDEVIVQYGFGKYIPQYCEGYDFISSTKMQQFMRDARIVITHGGPATFIMALQNNKVPIVVPREKKYGEHINDHQLLFTKEVDEKYNNLIVVNDMENLQQVIQNYTTIVKNKNSSERSNQLMFNKKFAAVVNSMFKGKI